MTRQEANRTIIEILAAEVERQPDVRFSQLMRNLGVVLEGILQQEELTIYWEDEFNLESEALLKRMHKMMLG